jgi:dGTPase
MGAMSAFLSETHFRALPGPEVGLSFPVMTWQPPSSSHLAPYACLPGASRGRLHAEPESRARSCYQRDRDRVIHSGAFRKLKHKTQVFVSPEGDYYRTRLTHSIEVSQITRTVCRRLGLDEDLGEALALAHDLGHTCFGHAGEDALDNVMSPYGGFDHNEQTFRIVTALERRYAEFDGLNLTWESLEGLVKHNGPLAGSGTTSMIPPSIASFQEAMDLELATHPSLEAQIAALSDDIAYINHDLDDGLRAGLFDVASLMDLPVVGEAFRAVLARHPGVAQARLIHESVRRLIGHMVDDLVTQTQARLEREQPQSSEDVRQAGRPIGAFSSEFLEQIQPLRGFLFKGMYRHPRVTEMTDQAKQVVRRLFGKYLAEPDSLPGEWREAAKPLGDRERARLVADYIAGMTDRFASKEHEKLFGVRVFEA